MTVVFQRLAPKTLHTKKAAVLLACLLLVYSTDSAQAGVAGSPNANVDVVSNFENSCPLALLTLNVTPTLQQCQAETMSSCPADVRTKCRGILIAAASEAQKNPQNIQIEAPPPCPIQPGVNPTLQLCQQKDTGVRGACSANILRQCKIILGTAFQNAQVGRPTKLVAAPTDWKAKQGLDLTNAVYEKRNRPGTPDFNNYGTVQRWGLESLAAGGGYANLAEATRRAFEQNGNQVTSCFEYSYENSYSLSRALDEYARQGNEPDQVYDLAFAPGGLASNNPRGAIGVRSRTGALKDLLVSLGNKNTYPLSGAYHYHRNAYLDAVYIAPILLMFKDRSAAEIPALPDNRFQAIRVHRQFASEPNFDWHRQMPGVMARVQRPSPGTIEGGVTLRTGFADQELDEEYQRQKQFSDLLERFISKALLSPYFHAESLNERFTPVHSINPETGATSTGLLGGSPLVFGDNYEPFVQLYENNSPQGAIRSQTAAFQGFLNSKSSLDLELRSMLGEIIRSLNSAPSSCVTNMDNRTYNQCDWSKALFADRLQEGLIRGDFVDQKFPARRPSAVFTIPIPGTAETEYQQCLHTLPDVWSAATLNAKMAEVARELIPPFCASGGQAITPNPDARNGARPIATANPDWTIERCTQSGGIWYETPQIAQGARAINYTSSSDSLKRGMLELEYIRHAKAALEAEVNRARLRALDPSMIGLDGKFQLPRVRQGGAGSMGNPDFASINYDFGFNWQLEGGANSSLCQYKPSFETHGRSSVSVLNHDVDIVDIQILVNKEHARAHAEILGMELFVPQDKQATTNFNPVNIAISRRKSDEVAYRQSLLIGPVPITLAMGVAGSIGFTGNVGIQQRGSPTAENCDAQGAEVILRGAAGPTIQLDAFASAGVGAEILGIGAEAGIRGDLTLIKVEPIAGLDSAIRLSDSRRLEDVQLQVYNVFAIPIQYMNGRISAYLRISYLVDSKTWRMTLVGWDGYRTSQRWQTHIRDLPLSDLKQALQW